MRAWPWMTPNPSQTHTHTEIPVASTTPFHIHTFKNKYTFKFYHLWFCMELLLLLWIPLFYFWHCFLYLWSVIFFWYNFNGIIHTYISTALFLPQPQHRFYHLTVNRFKIPHYLSPCSFVHLWSVVSKHLHPLKTNFVFIYHADLILELMLYTNILFGELGFGRCAGPLQRMENYKTYTKIYFENHKERDRLDGDQYSYPIKVGNFWPDPQP